MLQLKNIYKSYIVGEEKQQVLKDINVNFRKNEFVSILGASGSGKTTLLNIIGGLDVYDSGDLIIDNLSTKNFTKKNWDSYRNYKIGFVFQNYNLISHLSVLGNVELALTLSGINKKERRIKAKEALIRVGLKDHINKKPNQLSGGQMQRVAIARAIVNNPDIILADEPTGALDSNTSEQIMDILKEISKEKLIIMVTHNREIANEYSDRIIELRDGEIVGDSNNYNLDNNEDGSKIKFNKTNMPYLTTLSLSLKNLLTKKGRTFLTSFAGSIGIMGITLVLMLNSGLRNTIDNYEKKSVVSFPITVSQTDYDMNSLFSLAIEERPICSSDKICSYNNVVSSFNKNNNGLYVKNDIKSFKEYIENNNIIKEYAKYIDYLYDYDLPLYYKYKDEYVKLTNDFYVINEEDESANTFTGIKFKKIDFNHIKDNDEYILVAGDYPKSENDMILLIPNDGIINDSILYYLNIKDKSEIKDLINKKEKIESTTYSYDTFLNLKYKLIYNTDTYQKVEGKYVSKLNDKDYMNNLINNCIDLNVVGIVKYKSGSEDEQVDPCIYYSEDLFNKHVKYINDSEIVKEQINNKEIDVFSGEKFDNIYNSYDRNMILLNSIDLDNPESIEIVPKDFNSKNKIKEYIDNYNKIQEDNGNKKKKIAYNDEANLIISELSTLINGISAVLIGVVSVSLIVSSIMIAIITYISVLERTKEIGILRALGASGKDISRVFKSETIIEGVIAGVLGVGISILLSIPINIILKTLVKVDINFSLPLIQGVIMILLSVLLNVIAGLIPSKMASKKNPVEALRSE